MPGAGLMNSTVGPSSSTRAFCDPIGSSGIGPLSSDSRSIACPSSFIGEHIRQHWDVRQQRVLVFHARLIEGRRGLDIASSGLPVARVRILDHGNELGGPHDGEGLPVRYVAPHLVEVVEVNPELLEELRHVSAPNRLEDWDHGKHRDVHAGLEARDVEHAVGRIHLEARNLGGALVVRPRRDPVGDDDIRTEVDPDSLNGRAPIAGAEPVERVGGEGSVLEDHQGQIIDGHHTLPAIRFGIEDVDIGDLEAARGIDDLHLPGWVTRPARAESREGRDHRKGGDRELGRHIVISDFERAERHPTLHAVGVGFLLEDLDHGRLIGLDLYELRLRGLEAGTIGRDGDHGERLALRRDRLPLRKVDRDVVALRDPDRARIEIGRVGEGVALVAGDIDAVGLEPDVVADLDLQIEGLALENDLGRRDDRDHGGLGVAEDRDQDLGTDANVDAPVLGPDPEAEDLARPVQELVRDANPTAIVHVEAARQRSPTRTSPGSGP